MPIREIGSSYNDQTEILYHQFMVSSDENLIYPFLELSGEISPVHYCFKRLIWIGEKLKRNYHDDMRFSICGSLGNLYRALGKYQEAENAYREALLIRKRLAEINPDAYLSNYNIVLENIEILNNTKNE